MTVYQKWCNLKIFISTYLDIYFWKLTCSSSAVSLHTATLDRNLLYSSQVYIRKPFDVLPCKINKPIMYVCLNKLFNELL